MLEDRPGSRSGQHAAPGDDVRSLRYCCPAGLRFPGAGRDRPHVGSLGIAQVAHNDGPEHRDVRNGSRAGFTST